MLQVSKATDYALLFLTNLARQPERKWNVREASESLNISRRFLANITHQLARHGIITTAKGSGGGVTLGKNPGSLTIGEVVEVFEGRVNLVDCIHTQVDTNSPCVRDHRCNVRSFWETLSRDIEESLRTTTLQDLGENR